MAFERCPKCGKFFVEYDSYRRTKMCHNDSCRARINNDGSFSYISRDQDEIIKILRYPDGKEKIVYRYPS